MRGKSNLTIIMNKVYLGADHRGYRLKEKVKEWLEEGGDEGEGLGARELNPDDDYPVFAERVGTMVADNKGSRGILMCGSGVGVDVVANKFDGVRASVGKSKEQVEAGRADDDMNVLVLAADFTKEQEAKEIVKGFLETDFSGKNRHKRRIEEITRIEKNN